MGPPGAKHPLPLKGTKPHNVPITRPSVAVGRGYAKSRCPDPILALASSQYRRTTRAASRNDGQLSKISIYPSSLPPLSCDTIP